MSLQIKKFPSKNLKNSGYLQATAEIKKVLSTNIKCDVVLLKTFWLQPISKKTQFFQKI